MTGGFAATHPGELRLVVAVCGRRPSG